MPSEAPEPLRGPAPGTRLHTARLAGGRPNLGFATRLMVATTMPHSRTESPEFVRHSGLYDLCLLAPRPSALPYGRYPRLALTWIVTEAVRTRTPLLHPGPSLSAFATRIGITPSTGAKGTLQQLRDQLRSLLHLTVLCRSPSSSSPWALPASFGAGALKNVIKVYPAVRLRKSNRGLVLLPFPPHIAACGKSAVFQKDL